MKKNKKRIAAYMTLEASFLIPLAFILFLIIIYFGFYLYDQCVVLQGCYLASLRGSQIWTLSDSDLERVVRDEAEKLLDKQIFTNSKNCQVQVNALSIEVRGESEIQMKLPNYDLYNKERLGTNKVSKIRRLNPVLFIRECKKVR